MSWEWPHEGRFFTPPACWLVDTLPRDVMLGLRILQYPPRVGGFGMVLEETVSPHSGSRPQACVFSSSPLPAHATHGLGQGLRSFRSFLLAVC